MACPNPLSAWLLVLQHATILAIGGGMEGQPLEADLGSLNPVY